MWLSWEWETASAAVATAPSPSAAGIIWLAKKIHLPRNGSPLLPPPPPLSRRIQGYALPLSIFCFGLFLSLKFER